MAWYTLVAFGGLLLSVFISILTLAPFGFDDSGWLGLLWGVVFCAEAALIIPFSLALSAERIDRKLHARRFRWTNVLLRFLLAVPIFAGPVYAFWWVSMYVDDRRPIHWAYKEAFFYCLSAICGYFALRIRSADTPFPHAREPLVR